MILATAILTFATEALKAYNAYYADEPLEQRRAGAMLVSSVVKVIVYPLLTSDQRKELDALSSKPL